MENEIGSHVTSKCFGMYPTRKTVRSSGPQVAQSRTGCLTDDLSASIHLIIRRIVNQESQVINSRKSCSRLLPESKSKKTSETRCCHQTQNKYLAKYQVSEIKHYVLVLLEVKYKFELLLLIFDLFKTSSKLAGYCC